MMARTHNSINSDQLQPTDSDSSSPNTNTWNSDIFVQTVQELLPSFAWKAVVKELDHPEFFIRDKMALKLVVNALKRAIKADQFPIDFFYRVWKNSEGQLSWIIHSLKHPDIFCLADFQSKRTSTECLKAQPEDDNRPIASWRSLSLIEVLLNLSETGDYSNCIELFKFPITHCPDLLLLGLLQLTSIWNKLKQELISALIQ
jgi:CCR4-NOT transcription complex subunit 1